MYGSERGAAGNCRPYRDQRQLKLMGLAVFVLGRTVGMGNRGIDDGTLAQ